MDSRPKKKQKLSLESFSDTVYIMIGSGPNKAKVCVNRVLLSNASGYFKGATSEAWVGADKVATLEEDPQIFSIFLAWVHTADLKSAKVFIDCSGETSYPPSPDDATKKNTEDPPLLHTQQFEQLVSCYLMGDFIQAPDFQNAVINQMIENARTQTEFAHHIAGYSNAIISKVYGGTRAEDPLRCLLHDLFTSQLGAGGRGLKLMMNGESNGLLLWHLEVLEKISNSGVPDVIADMRDGDPDCAYFPDPWSPFTRGVCERYHQHPGESKEKGFDCNTFKYEPLDI